MSACASLDGIGICFSPPPTDEPYHPTILRTTAPACRTRVAPTISMFRGKSVLTTATFRVYLQC